MCKKLILWIEDRPDLVVDLIEIVKKKNFQISLECTTHGIKDALDENPVGIIVDVMLMGLDYYFEGIPTDQGMKAGWVLLEHYIRVENSPYKNIPVLVLSAKAKSNEEQQHLETISQRGGAPIHYLEKQSPSWQKDFEYWLNQLSN